MNGELVSVDNPKSLFEALREVKRELKNAEVIDDGIELVTCPNHLKDEVEKRINEVKEEARKQILNRDDEEVWLLT